MAAKKQATRARHAPVGYVFADADGAVPSEVFCDVDKATDDAKQYLADCVDVDAQVIFALVAVRRVARGGFIITDITE